MFVQVALAWQGFLSHSSISGNEINAKDIGMILPESWQPDIGFYRISWRSSYSFGSCFLAVFLNFVKRVSVCLSFFIDS